MTRLRLSAPLHAQTRVSSRGSDLSAEAQGQGGQGQDQVEVEGAPSRKGYRNSTTKKTSDEKNSSSDEKNGNAYTTAGGGSPSNAYNNNTSSSSSPDDLDNDVGGDSECDEDDANVEDNDVGGDSECDEDNANVEKVLEYYCLEPDPSLGSSMARGMAVPVANSGVYDRDVHHLHHGGAIA